MKYHLAIVILLSTTPAFSSFANDSFNSEFSHFSGDFALAGATTVIVDKYYPEVEHPALVGFTVAASESVLGEVAEYASGGHMSLLDIAAGTFGAAAGSYITNKFYIAPQIDYDTKTYGMVMKYQL